jgi:hypothetical protein
MALAASLLVAIGVVLARRPAEAPDVLRGEAVAVRATRPAAGETVREPITFAWEPVPGASRYTVELVTADGRVAWSTETTEPRATLRDASVLVGGGEYRWWVRVTGGPAHQRTSEPRLVRIAGK